METALLSSPSQLLQLVSTLALQSQNASEVPVLQRALDDLSRELVADKTLRIQLGSQPPSIWTPLNELWTSVARAQSTKIDSDAHNAQLVLSLAKFTRNLVADVPNNQRSAFPLEPQIRQLIYLHTAWTRATNENAFAIPRMLTQTLSNLVTGNQDLLDEFWGVHMGLPEEQSVLIRLLGLPDLRTVISVLVLITNCIHDSRERGRALVTASIGIRVCASILDRLEGLLDASELGYETKVFELGYALFSKLFQFGYFPQLYNQTSLYADWIPPAHAPALTARFRDDEPVSPTQTTLLKLLDSFLHTVPTPFRDRGDYRQTLAGFLTSAFLFQAEYTQRAIQQAMGAPSPDQYAPTGVRESTRTAAQTASCSLDGRLPGVWVALVLLSTSLSSILLAEQEQEHSGGASTGPSVVTSSHDAIAASRSRAGTGFIEELLETLRLLDVFFPRINFGKVKVIGSSSDANAPSPNGREADPGQSADVAGFPYLKRDLVRLLGILCHNSKAIQDRIRLCGGIPILLNLCVIDERNPYLREHALFALRNLLHDNPENQAVVDTFRVSR